MPALSHKLLVDINDKYINKRADSVGKINKQSLSIEGEQVDHEVVNYRSTTIKEGVITFSLRPKILFIKNMVTFTRKTHHLVLLNPAHEP